MTNAYRFSDQAGTQYTAFARDLRQARSYFRNHPVYRNWGFRYIGPEQASPNAIYEHFVVGVDVAGECERARQAFIANGGDPALLKRFYPEPRTVRRDTR